MKKFIFIMMLLPVAVLAQTAFQGFGFSIQPPVLREIPDNQAIVLFYFPASEEFAPNVGVIRQTYPESAAKYKELTDSQLKDRNAEVIASKIAGGTYLVEYAMAVNGKKMHFYSKAVFKDGKVLLATAAATPAQWKKLGNEMKKVVDSLSLI